MVNMILLHVTIDHDVIISWAQRRGALPSTFEGDERPWPLFFDFNPAASGLREISWDRFFVEVRAGRSRIRLSRYQSERRVGPLPRVREPRRRT